MAKALMDMHPMQVVFFRALGSTIFIIPYMLYKRISLVGHRPKLLFARAVVGLISLATFFTAIQRIPLGSAISIRYLGPIFGAGLAYIFLKEKINKWQIASFIIAFAGVLLIKGFDPRIDLFSFILMGISAFFIGIVFVLIRYLATREHFLTIINYFMLTSILASLFFVSQWRLPLSEEIYSVIGIGIFGLFGQVLMTNAFRLETASILAPFKYLELVFAVFLSFMIFSETYTFIVLAGMLMILTGTSLNVVAKNKLKKITKSV